MHWFPTVNNPLVARFPIGVVSLDKKAGFDFKIEAGFIGEVDANRMVAKLGRELDSFNGFAFGLGKPHDFPRPVGLLLVGRTFSFSLSHFLSCVEGIWSGIRQRGSVGGFRLRLQNIGQK
jgi:hypothetical protein